MQGNSEQSSLHEYLQTLMHESQSYVLSYEFAIFMSYFKNPKLLNLLQLLRKLHACKIQVYTSVYNF